MPGNEGGPPRARRGLPAKREAIMEAALDLFVRQGYAATTLDDIATATPVSRQTVYNHFGDKETLFRAVIDTHLNATLEALHAPADQPVTGPAERPVDAESQLNDLARRLTAIFLNPRTASLRRLLQSEGPRQPHLLELWRTRVAGPVWSEVISQLTRLTHAGALRIDDPVRAASQFIVLVTGTAWQITEVGVVLYPPPPGVDGEQLDTAVRSCVALFVRGYRQTTP
ncbi:TetR/AcrR family transcriptional regulator [Parafrankia sp. FMc6]|uniref:TetR/AcrR family transcriptional regulator n=1 Tax=Parafrankia soli TaxID=2599596 RepID=UPI0034D4EF06